MNLVERLSPTHVISIDSLQALRESIVQALLLAVTGLGLMASLAGFMINGWGFITPNLTPTLLCWLWLATVLVWRELPYPVRAGSLALLPFALAINELFTTSLLGFILLWLSLFATSAALFFGFRWGLAAAGVNILTIITMGLALQMQLLSLRTAGNFFLGVDWVLATLLIALVSAAAAMAVAGLVSGQTRLLREIEKTSADTKKAHVAMERKAALNAQETTHRLTQVRATAEIANAISRWKGPGPLYQQVVDLLQKRFDLYYAGIFLVDENRRYAVLAAGSGTQGQALLELKHRLPVGPSSMVGWCISNRRARIALDASADEIRYQNPHLPLTRSEIALPILRGDNILGALTIQAARTQAFDPDDILAFQGIADSLAAAVENTSLIADLKRNKDELRSLNHTYLRQSWTEAAAEHGTQQFAYKPPASSQSEDHTIDVPILLRDQIIATLSLDTSDPGLSAEEEDFLEALTTQTALALENARLVQKTERRADQEQTLNDLSARFSNALDIDSILKAAVEALGSLPSVSEVSVELIPPEQPARPGQNGQEHNG